MVVGKRLKSMDEEGAIGGTSLEARPASPMFFDPPSTGKVRLISKY